MFGRFKKRTDRENEPPPPALGWEAIERAFGRLYPGQTPTHWAHDGVMRMHDLKDPPENPLDGANIYDAGSHWHYVSLGLSDLYGKESKGDWSGYGYEFTFRLAKSAGEDGVPLWPINILVSMAKAAYKGSEFAPCQTANTGPLDGDPRTKVTALLLARDPAFDLQATPNGKLAFIQLVGVEGPQRERALQVGVQPILDQLQAQDRDLVTMMR
jgi:hypothetical protein